MLRKLSNAIRAALGNAFVALEPHIDAARNRRKLRGCVVKGDVTLRSHVTISHGEKLTFNGNVLVNHYTLISAGGGITIGKGVVIGPNCQILTTNHVEPTFYGHTRYKPVTIGDNVWLGAGVIVLPGAIIGDNVFVAAGAVVSGTLDKPGMYQGIPAKWSRDLREDQ